MQELTIAIGKDVNIQVFFEASGEKLAVWHHGTPNPRELSADVLAAFARHGYSVACPIRPGYGDSTLVRTDGQTMSDMAPITAAVVAHLGFEKFVSFGHSSGGARALSDVATLDQALAAVTFATVGPVGESDLNPHEGIDPEELEMLEATRDLAPEVIAQFEKWAPSFGHAWAFKNGALGWALDEHSMMVPWGFDVRAIDKPVLLFTGDADPNVNPVSSRWLASKITGAKLTELPNRDHDQIVEADVVEQALTALDAAL